MPLQNTANFYDCKRYNFQLIFFFKFHILAQEIDYGHNLEPPH